MKYNRILASMTLFLLGISNQQRFLGPDNIVNAPRPIF